METSNEKQVTIKKDNLPSDILFEADAAQGLENVKTENLALPILKLLQNGSGEAQKLLKITLKVQNQVCF